MCCRYKILSFNAYKTISRDFPPGHGLTSEPYFGLHIHHAVTAASLHLQTLHLSMLSSLQMTSQEFVRLCSWFASPLVAGGLTLDPCRRHTDIAIENLNLVSTNLSFLCISDCSFLNDKIVHTLLLGFEADVCRMQRQVSQSARGCDLCFPKFC